MNTVKVGQIWHDKDKRRDRTVRVIDTFTSDADGIMVLVKDEATGKESELKAERFVTRWEMVHDVKEMLPEADTHALSPDEVKAIVKHEPLPVPGLTREAWLEQAVEALRELFKPVENVTIPTVRVSVGWPGGRGPKSNVVGQCWAAEAAGDKMNQIFVSPVQDNPVEVLETLAHEMIHASDNGESKHRAHFARVARAIGFLQPMKSTPASDELKAKLTDIAEELGTYPHAAISVLSKPKVQKTYMVKIIPGDCNECDPDYKLRMTEKWLDEAGAPLCPHGIQMVEG